LGQRGPNWPECEVFANARQTLGLTREEWAAGMTGNMAYLNRRLIEAVDAILVRHPGATIVLFSDHGGRLDTEDMDEWHRSFLAARTSSPRLFADEPRPDALLRLLGYRSPSSQEVR